MANGTLKQTLIVSLLTFVAGFFVCKQFAEPEVRTEIKEVKVKEVVVVKEERKREERRPDGTVIIETDTTTSKHSETKKDTNVSLLTSDKPQWSAGIYTNVNTDRYLITLDRRIIGNVFAGMYGAYDVKNDDLSGGLGLRIEF